MDLFESTFLLTTRARRTVFSQYGDALNMTVRFILSITLLTLWFWIERHGPKAS
jgi:hypothetical protein